jgi:hypothetical protein
VSTLKTIKLQNPSGSSSNIDLGIGGEVLIGSAATTGTASQRLQVTGGAYVSGNIGLGTTNPSAKLSVFGPVSIGNTNTTAEASGFPVFFKLVNNDTANYGGAMYNESYGSSNEPGILFRRARGTLSSPTQILLDDRIGYVIGSGFGNSTFSNNTAIEFYAEENQSESARGSYIRFQTTNIGATSRTEKVRITANGNVGIGITNPGAKLHVSGGSIKVDSGYGIDFSANANAAGTTSELLNDYEEGTFTPSMSGTFTYTTRTGKYTKIGNLVHIDILITWSANTSGAVNATITGLPFTVASSRTCGTFGYVAGLDTGGDKMITSTAATGETYIGLWIINDNTTPTAMGANSISSTGEIQLSITYLT